MACILYKERTESLRKNALYGLTVITRDAKPIYIKLDASIRWHAMDAFRRQSDRPAIAEGLAEILR